MVVVAAGLCLSGRGAAQNVEGGLRPTFEGLYARVDAAVAGRDEAELERLLAPDGQAAAGPVNVSLRVWVGSAMQVAGLSRRSEVAAVRLDGADAVVTVNVHFTVVSGGTTKESVPTYRERWVRRQEGWVCKESARIGGESNIPSTSPEAAKPVVAELQARAAKLATVDPGAGMDDLEAFGAAVGDARIVALGEASHGTLEFFQMKQRLVEYLVRRKGFTVLAMEMNWPDVLSFDRYIKAPGDARAPSGMSEMQGLMEWMRARNRAAGAGRPLTWTGFDMQSAGLAADAAVGYLRQYAPELARGAEDVYQDARRLGEGGLTWFLPGAAECVRRAEAVLAQFDAHRADWVRASSNGEWRDARHAAATVVAACAARVEANGFGYRDRTMARNVEWLADEVHPGEKIIVWAHNAHVAMDNGAFEKMGGWLRQRFGRQYYTVGFAFRRGEVWAMGTEDGRSRGDGAWPLAASPEGSGDAILSAAGMPLFFLDLRPVPRDGSLGAWLAAPHRFHEAMGVVTIGGEGANMATDSLAESFDGLVFVENSHAIHPR
jgi:erythromycin esterase